MTAITDPLRLHVMKALCDALREITPANGYVLDFSGDEGTRDNKVYRGRAVFGDSDSVPMLSVLETPIPLDQIAPPSGSTLSSGGWELMIQGFLEDDKDNPTDPAYVALADVKKRLAVEKAKQKSQFANDGIFGVGKEVMDIQIGSGVCRPPDEISAKTYFWLLITLELAEDIERPYEVTT